MRLHISRVSRLAAKKTFPAVNQYGTIPEMKPASTGNHPVDFTEIQRNLFFSVSADQIVDPGAPRIKRQLQSWEFVPEDPYIFLLHDEKFLQICTYCTKYIIENHDCKAIFFIK